MSSLSDRAALLIVANGLKYGMAFVLPMMLVRLMSQGDYGTYQQLTLIANVGGGLMVLGIPSSVYYFYSRAHRPTLIAQTQLALLATGGLTGLAVAFGAGPMAAAMHNPDLVRLLPPFAIYLGFYVSGELFIPVFISQDRYFLAVGSELSEIAVRTTTLVVVLWLGYHLHAVVLALLAYAATRFVSRNFWLWRGPDPPLKASWKSRFIGDQLAFGLPLAISTCVGLLGYALDKAIVAFSFSPTDYAIYAVGALEIPLDRILQMSVANVLSATLPALAREGRIPEIIQRWRESVRKLSLIVLPCFVFLFCFASRFITTLFTARYRNSVPIFETYVLALPLNCFVFSIMPQIFGKTRLNLYAGSVGVGGNVLMSLVLLHLVGMYGPAIAFVLSGYLTASIYFIATRRLLHAPSLQLVPVAAMGRTLGVAVVAVIPAYAITFFLSGLGSLIAGGVVFSACYVGAGLASRVFQPSDIATAQAWLRKLAPASARA